MEPIRVGVLTVSDRCSQGEQEDLSGPAVQAALPPDGFVVALQAVVPDEQKAISATLRRWCDDYHPDLVLTVGGTGFGPRDVTPEATRKVLEREAANLAQFVLWEGLKQTPFAALSRGLAGIRGGTLIVNLPGSPEGARSGTECLAPLLPHAVAVLRREETGHPPA